jgi:hypothetical protein
MMTTKSNPEHEAIVQIALNYIEGWYEGNAERMHSSLHPDLAKRIVRIIPQTERSVVEQMSAVSLVEATRVGYGKQIPEAERRSEVKVLDVFENVASVRVDATDWIDYLHVAKCNGEWKIINVLWEMRPSAQPRRQ